MSNPLTISRILRALVVLAAVVLSTVISPARAQQVHQSVTLNFWTPLGDPISRRLLQPYFNQFEKKYPFIHVNFVDVASDNNWIKYTTAMAAGRGPDFILTTGYNPPIPEWAANGFIQPLDPWFLQLHISQNKWLPWVWKMQYFHDHVWGFVQEYDTTLFAWNKDAFRKAGLDPNRPPRTIAELDSYTKKLIKFDKRGNLVSAGFVPWGTPSEEDARQWSVIFGGGLYDQAHRRYTINSAANVRALEWEAKYAKMLGGPEKVTGFLSKFTGNNDPLYTGQVAMEVVGDWYPIYNFKPYAPHMHYGIAAIPTPPGVPYGTNILIGSDTFAMPVGAKHPKEAAELMLYMMGSAPVLTWCIGEANVPPTRAAAFSPAFLSGVPFMATAVETARMALTDPRVLNPFPSSSIYDYVSTRWSTTEQEVLYGRKSAQAALNELQKLADQREAAVKRDNPAWYRNGD